MFKNNKYVLMKSVFRMSITLHNHLRYIANIFMDNADLLQSPNRTFSIGLHARWKVKTLPSSALCAPLYGNLEI